MAKPPSDDPRVHTVSMRLTDGEVDLMDAQRGQASRSTWLRIQAFGDPTKKRKGRK